MKAGYVFLALAFCGISAQSVVAQGIQDYDSLVANLTQSILGKVEGASSSLSSLLPDTSSYQAELTSLSGQLETLYTTFEAQFCTEASFDFGKKKPATFVGPSFDITFDTGSCLFNETVFWETGDKELDCVEPSITFTKTPAVFTSKRKTPIIFTSKTCNISKTFGEDSTTVLYTFDGSKQPTVSDLTAKITDEVKTALSTLTSSVTTLPSTITNLVDSIPTLSEVEAGAAALLHKTSPSPSPSPAVPVSGARVPSTYAV